LRRTSADWWEDEEEFDAVAGEVLLPKTLYVLSVPSPSEAARSTPTLEQDPQKQQGEAEEWLVEYSAELLKGHLENGKCATVGFSGNETFGIASGVWSAWGASGPPYFKKVKKREALDRMAQGSNPGDAESLLKEIFSQNWRVELDAGLGVDLNPREHLLIVCTQPASMLLLETLGFKKLGKSDGGVVLSKVELDGWNTSDMKAEDLLPLEDWRDLKPRLIGRQYSHPPSF